jgi:hypothetical protein
MIGTVCERKAFEIYNCIVIYIFFCYQKKFTVYRIFTDKSAGISIISGAVKTCPLFGFIFLSYG